MGMILWVKTESDLPGHTAIVTGIRGGVPGEI